MNRGKLDDLLRRFAQVSGRNEATMIGSQCLHAAVADVPDEVVMSVECDLVFDSEDPVVKQVDAELGRDSPYHQEHPVYIDPIVGTFPFMPEGWEARARVIDLGEIKIRCLEPNDLALSKLAAGRLKDSEVVAVMIQRKLVDPATLRQRIERIADLHARASLLARLQIVCEAI